MISLGELIREEKLYIGVDRERDTLIADIDRVYERVKEIILSSDRDVVVEGHLAPYVVPPEYATIAFVLRRSPEELKRVLKDRNYSERKIAENLAAEILDVCLYDAVNRFGIDKVYEINTTSRDPEDVVNEILEVLKGLRGHRVGIVDWLGELEAKGKLKEYLREF